MPVGSRSARERRCILLVEDERDARETLARVLRSEGYDCIEAESVPAALAAARSAHFIDIVVADIVLETDGLDGVDLIGELHAHDIHAPVVLVTAFADSARVKRALNAGAAYLIEKPFRAQNLLPLLERLQSESYDLAHLVDRALSKAGLTDKEAEVARLLLKGLSNEEIARVTTNSDKTIRQHVTAVYRKVGVTSRAEFFHFVFPT